MQAMTGNRERRMENYPDEAWQRLGKLLRQRRPLIDPRYRVRRVFAADNHLTDKTVQEVENAYRSTFSDQMLTAIEVAYRLPPGTDGGPPHAPVPPAPSPPRPPTRSPLTDSPHRVVLRRWQGRGPSSATDALAPGPRPGSAAWRLSSPRPRAALWWYFLLPVL